MDALLGPPRDVLITNIRVPKGGRPRQRPGLNNPTNDPRLARYAEKPKPDFDWSDLDQVYAPPLPPGAISRQDILKHYREQFGIKERRADQLTLEAIEQGFIKKVPGRRGWYVKP